jgi:protein-disulfide isomerase
VRLFILSILAVVTLVSCSSNKGSDEVLAVVNGEKITLGDLEVKNEELKKQLFELNERIYKYKRIFLDQMIQEKLIELQAKKEGVGSVDLIKREISSKLGPISDQDVVAFAKEKGIPDEQVAKLKDRIKSYLSAQNEKDLRDEYAKTLKKSFSVDIKLKKPQKSKVSVSISDKDASVGPEGAKVTVIEFSEFECPFCKKASYTLNSAKKEFGDKVRFVFKHFPLNFHRNAQRAAEASVCANKQNKFFEYHDQLFENSKALAESDLITYAKKIGLDMKKFEECLKSDEIKKQVESDIEQGKKLGLRGVPAFFVNGAKFVGAIGYPELKEAIEEAMSE